MTIPTDIAGVSIRPYEVPNSVEADNADDYLAMVTVRNQVFAEISGNDDEAMSPEALLPMLQPTPYSVRHFFIIELEGEVVGRGGLDLPQEEGSNVALWYIDILEKAWSRGIGSAMLAHLESLARAAGRTHLQTYAEHKPGSAESVPSPTGFGAVPHDHVARFLQYHGYALSLVERKSVFDLTADSSHIEALAADARAKARDYDIVSWVFPTPAEFVEGFCRMQEHMSVDVPSGELEVTREVWNEDRLRTTEKQYLDAGRNQLVTAARHRATGALVAYNELALSDSPTDAVMQNGTFVLRDHRGHRLGALVKTAGIARLRELAPDAPRIVTWNAEENRPMLAVNEALGFAAAAYIGAWQKTLAS